MKYSFFGFILSLFFLAFVSSCNMGQKPQAVAEEFLNAYFAAEYEDAAKLCTPALGNDLLEALEEVQALDEPIRENIQKHTKYYKPQITQTEEPQKKDSVTINYIVVKAVSDSLSAPATEVQDKIKESRLHLVKTREGWRVSALK